MSPAAMIHLQNSDSAPDSTFPPFTAEPLNPSATATRAKSRPRLAKLRKHSRSKSRTSAADGDVAAAAGFNPFRSDQVTGSNVSSCGSGVFVFGAGIGGSASARDFNFELGGNVGFREGSGSSGNGGVENGTGFGKGGGVEFVFSAKQSDMESNSRKKTGGKGAGSVSGDERKVKLNLGVEEGFVFGAERNNLNSGSNTENGKSGFVFGDSYSGKASSVNVEKQGSFDCMGNLGGGMGAFSTKVETNSRSDTGDDGKIKNGYGSTNGVSFAFGAIPACKLTDEIKKLNINHSEGGHSSRDSMNSHVNSGAGFVFGGGEKVCGSFSASSGTNAEGQQSCTNAAFENIAGQYFKACETNDVQNATGCGTSYDSSGIPCSKPSTSQEGVTDFQCGKVPQCSVSDDSQVNGAAARFSSSSFGLDSHPNNYTSTGHSLSEDHDKCDNHFTSIPEASKEPFMDFMPPAWDPSCFKDNLFPKSNKKSESTQKGRSSKEKGSKHMRRKSKPRSLNKRQTEQDHLSKENSSLETPDSLGGQSPMDFSPYHYQETEADDQNVKASEGLNVPHSTIPSDYKDDHLAGVGRGVDIGTSDQRCGGPDNEKTEPFSSTSIAGASADAGVDLSSNTERQKAGQFHFVHGLCDSKEKNFAFSASSTVDGTSSSFKRKQKKKFRRKVGHDSFVITPNLNGKFGSSVQFSSVTTANMPSHSDSMDRSQINDQFKEGDVASSSTIQEACDKWRLRGNQAYKDGDLSKAEDFYTLGINSVPSSGRSGSCIKPLLLCYSNRAATRMSLGRIGEALGDCVMAAALDPSFLKVQMRTANCHLLLGDVENAQQCFNKCLESGNVVCLDRRVVVEAAEGLQKAQKVGECLNNATELLKKRTSDAAGTALELLTKAFSISLYSEKLLQLKAEALLLLQKYDAAIQLCEQTQYLAEKNYSLANSANNFNISIYDGNSQVKLWRWSLISRCYFHLGRLEASLNVLEKLLQVVSVNDKCVIDNIKDLLSLAATIRELLDQKRTGNENFKMGKYTEAVEKYTLALSSTIKPRPFAAICFCNRAAAHQALGQIADAIADCSMAMALDGNYTKAISRRATLHEMVRDYEQAVCDLRRLISVFETQSNEKAKQSGSPNGSNGMKESRQAHQRLLSVEDQAKKGTPLDFYLILGIKPADTATDIKKAYHKAALRHHPDKAGQLLTRSEVGDEGQVWKEILQEVHKDADRLFKMIGEAYAVLSDPAKRSEYDLEEEIRAASKQNYRGGTGRKSSDFYGYGHKSPSDRTQRRNDRDHWKTYGHSYSRW